MDMKNIPKPTPEFNTLIAESDYLMSKIALIVQTRINLLNPIEEDIEILDKFLDNKKNLKKTHGDPYLKKDFLKNIRGKNPFFGGFSDERANEILERYNSIVKKRNMIAHSLPCVINGKYAKKYRDFNKKEDIIVDEDFLREFNKEAKDFIQIMENPDYAPAISELAKSLKPMFKEIDKIMQSLQQSLMSNVKMPDIVIPNFAIEKTAMDAIFRQMKQAADSYIHPLKNIHPLENIDNVKMDAKSEDNNSTQK